MYHWVGNLTFRMFVSIICALVQHVQTFCCLRMINQTKRCTNWPVNPGLFKKILFISVYLSVCLLSGQLVGLMACPCFLNLFYN